MSRTLPVADVPFSELPASRPAMTRLETKAEAISRAAMETIQQEVAKREAKTAQLRAARLAKEAADRAATPKPEPARRKAGASR